MTASSEYPSKVNVQRLIVYGYTLECSRHFILRVSIPASARKFLAGLVRNRRITDASVDNAGVVTRLNDESGCCPTNIGFTFSGLKKLELPTPYLRVFQEKAPAFCEGTHPRAARRLGDTGASAARWWEDRFLPDRAHVLLSMYADDPGDLKECTATLRKMEGAEGLDCWDDFLDGRHLTKGSDNRTVHFGFRDGISNPLIKGFHPSGSAPQAPKLHEPGEFVLGYANDEAFNPWLLVNPWPRPNAWLPPFAPIKPEFFWNGSFAAFRKIGQDEPKFRAFVSDSAKRLNIRPEYLEKYIEEYKDDCDRKEKEGKSPANLENYIGEKKIEYVRAKLAGRWDDGQVVKPDTPKTPGGKDPSFNETIINDFTFADDLNGEGCPFGAHIRRMNPREDPSVVPFRRRPLARRGMPYGPKFEPDADDENAKAERGLLGLFFCASLEDQFEHLLAEWGNANPMGPDNRGNAKDPLIGNHENWDSVFDIPGESSCQLSGFKPFVTTRGTLYAFYPSLPALDWIAQLDPKKPDEFCTRTIC